MLENKLCCQEVELTELKDSHTQKVSSYKTEIENLKAECSSRFSISKDPLKLNNDLEVTSKKLESLQRETIALRKTIAEKNREIKQIQKTNTGKSFQEKI